VKIDPSDDRPVGAPISAGPDPTSVVVVDGKLWVTNESTARVTPIDASTRTAEPGIAVGRGPDSIAAVGHAIWVASRLDGTVWRIDPGTRTATRAVPVGRDPHAIAAAAGRVVVAGADDVTILDGRTGSLIDAVSADGEPTTLAADGRTVWVAAAQDASVHRGGTLRVATSGLTFPAACPRESLDPQSCGAYTPIPWQISRLTHDGLVAFKQVPGPDGQTVVADLAQALPEPSVDGLTYVFRLRPRLSYSDGRRVHASDLRRGIERMYRINPPGRSFFGYYAAIAGAARCEAHPRTCDLRGGIVADDARGTVTFHLTRRDPDLLAQLALPFAMAVPPEAPDRDVLFRVQELPATGPYMVESADAFVGATLKRNPAFRMWSADAQPDGYPDRIQWTVARLAEKDMVDEVVSGRFDWLDDELVGDPARQVQIHAPSLLHVNVRPSLGFLGLTLKPPFDNALARRALNYAVDRTKVARLLGPLVAAPTCQLLPPNFPGYRPLRCPFSVEGGSTPDLARARRLVAESGTMHQPVRVLAGNDPVSVKFTRYVAGVLGSLGYRARLVSGDQGTDMPFTVAASQWTVDYPAAAAMLGLPGWDSSRVAPWVPDRWFDRMRRRALAAQQRDPAQATRLWAAIDARVTRAGSTWLPLFNYVSAGLTSRRVGHYLYSPAASGPLIDQLWVR
jgi:ABC-type transport system substrate-binding protein